MRRFSVLLLILLVVPTLCARRGVSPEDYFNFEFVSDPHLSPNGRQVAYVVTTVDEKANRRRTSLWVVATDGGSPSRRLTSEGASATHPRWSPDGTRLAFLSSRGGEGDGPARAQIFVLRMDGGEAQAVTKMKNGVSSFQWSPDGLRFVAVSRSGPSDDVPASAKKSDVRHYTHIRYKFNDTGWFDDKRTHLWVVEAVTGNVKQITSGDDWNDADPQWSPDGTKIAFVSDRTGKEYEDSHNRDVWVIPADGGELTKISDHPYDDTQPRWSPDGKRIAFTGQTERRQFPQIYVSPASGGSPSTMINPDLIPTDLTWLSENELRFEAGVRGEFHLFRAGLTNGAVAKVTSGPRAVRAADLNPKAGLAAYIANDFQHLDDVYVAKIDGSAERKLTNHNARLWGDLELAGVERITYKSTDGWDVEGFLVKPLGFDPTKKYPLVLSVHGGPAGQYGVDWYHEFQVYAARGWAVFFCNPRGSTGYGQKFERGIVNNWGGMDYADVMAGLDAAIAKNGWIDTGRLGVTGGSYGGFMTNWIVGHTNRFKAAVTLRSVVNFISDEGTRDGAYGHEDDFQGILFDNFAQYWNASPLKYAKNVKTPTLILHSDNDFRVPLEQGEQWYRALKHYGVTTEIVMFPRENHNLTRTGEPKHLVESLNWQIWWFEKYMMGNAAAKAPDAP